MSDDTLTAEDYDQLDQMQMSSDEGVRAQASTLAKKLTPDEQKAFFQFQQQRRPQSHETTEIIPGVPGDLAALMVTPIGSAMGRAGLSAAERAVSGIKAATSVGSPIIKFHVVKGVLQHLGVPSVLADTLAVAASGYKKGGAIAAAETAPSTVTASTEAAVPTLAAEAAPAAQTVSTVTNAAKPVLNAIQTKEYVRLLKSGKTGREALDLIRQQQELIDRLGLPTDKAVKIESDYIAAHGRRQQ